MKELGYGKDYKYPHNYPDHYISQDYLPDKLSGRRYYFPARSGKEAELSRRLNILNKKDNFYKKGQERKEL